MIVLLWLSAVHAMADGIGYQEAVGVAREFFSRRDVVKKHKAKSVAPRLLLSGRNNGYYLFTQPQEDGFVVVGGSGRQAGILAYSEQGRLTDGALPPALAALLKAYDRRRSFEAAATTRMPGKAVPPLLQSVRHQETPYNGMCPYYTYDDGRVSTTRCLVGCVATSVEQVMTYYQHPVALKDTLYGWTTPHFSLEDVSPGAVIDWEHILPDYSKGYTEQEARAVQELSLYCGMGCRMQYGVNASGAELREFMNTLNRVFDYAYARFHDRALYTPARWNRMLRYELEHARPVVYTGHNVEQSGHAFVVDGVDASGYYHLNWGYGGSYDGYFDLDVLNPFETAGDYTEAGRYEGFFCNQTALFMHPRDVEALDEDTLEMRPDEVTYDKVVFGRQPDTQGYVPVDFYLTHHGTDTLTYTFEVLTYLPADTAIFAQAEYVGLTGATLLPGRQTRVTAYCRFRRTGERLLGCSPDGTYLPFVTPVTVEQGTASRLRFSGLRIDALAGDSVRFLLQVANEAPSGSDGSLITYCLFREGEDDDVRHWTFLNLPCGTTCTDTVTFRGLQPETDYVLRVRCPWAVVAEQAFRLSDATDVSAVTAAVGSYPRRMYSLQGQLVGVCADEYGWQRLLRRLPAGCYVVRRPDGTGFKQLIPFSNP